MHRFLRSLLPLALLTSVACSDEAEAPREGSPPDDESPMAELDGGMTSRIDASIKPPRPADSGPASDASGPVKTDAGSMSDGGLVADASVSLPRLKPKCMKKPSQLMMIGDSYMNWITHTFGADMARESKQSWRMEAIGAYSMGSGGIGFVPDQYKTSIARDPDCHTILMTGGGNDVLVADATIDPGKECTTAKSPTLPQCQVIIDKALAAADTLLQKASKDGIRDVVYFFYPHVPENTPVGGPNPNPILDKALPQVRDFCSQVEGKTNGKTRCHFLDLVPIFEGHMPEWYQPFDIHENALGSAAIAKAVWDLMKAQCIGQPSGSGCCEE